jgi:hypothetical protein
MPKGASAATKALAEAVALERAKSGTVSMCRACGVTATQSDAVRCTVCGSTDFEVISREMIERIAEVEGGLEEETTYDGRKLRWTEEARKGLWTMKNAYQRRRVKARVEKSARMKRLDAITLEFARQVIEEETGAPLEIQAPSTHATPAHAASTAARRAGSVDAARSAGSLDAARSEGSLDAARSAGSLDAARSAGSLDAARRAGSLDPAASAGDEAKLIARDERKNPLISTFDWSGEATQRIFRVPAGFMRSKTQERIEELARERAAATIDLALVEEGIEIAKKMMAEMIATYSGPGASPSVTPAAAPASGNGSSYLNEVSARNARSADGT